MHAMFVFTVLGCSLVAQEQEPSKESERFVHASVAEALQRAGATREPVLIAFLRKGCFYSTRLLETAAAPRVDEVLAGMICVRSRIDAADLNGSPVLQSLRVDVTPALVMLAPDGSLRDVLAGAMEEEELTTWLRASASRSFVGWPVRTIATAKDAHAVLAHGRAFGERGFVRVATACFERVAAHAAASDIDRQEARRRLAEQRLEAGDPEPLLGLLPAMDGEDRASSALMLARHVSLRQLPMVRAQLCLEAIKQSSAPSARDLNEAAWILARLEYSGAAAARTHHELALGFALRARGMDPGSSFICDTAAECLARLDRLDEAVIEMERAVAAAPDTWRPWQEQRLRRLLERRDADGPATPRPGGR